MDSKTYSQSPPLACSRWWVAALTLAAILIAASVLEISEWIRIILAVLTMAAIAQTKRREDVTIRELWNAMPRDVQRKTSCHDLKRICDNLNGQWSCPECFHETPIK